MIFNFISKAFGHAARLACGSVLAVTLVSCGGGGGSAGTVPNSGGSGVAQIQLTLSSSQIVSTSTTPVVVTATALDANNNAVPNVTVQFAASSGVLTPTVTPAVTNSSGVVTANLTLGSNTTPRTIGITATGGGATGTTSVIVTGGAATNPSISLLLSSPTLPSSGFASTDVTLTAVLVDQNNNALAGVPVTFTSDSGILVGGASATTNASGLATVTLGTNGNPTNRTINVTASGDGVTAKGTVAVTGTTVTATGAASSLTINVPAKFAFNVQDSSGNNIPNAAVTFSSAAGNTVTGDASDSGTAAAPLTNASGNVILDVTPTVAGADTLTVTVDGASTSVTFTTTSQSLAVTLSDITTSPATVLNVTPQPLIEYTGTSCIQVGATYLVNGAGAAGTASVSTSRGTLYTNANCTTLAATPAIVPFSSGTMQPLYLQSTTAGAASVTVSETTGNATGPTQTAIVNFNAQLTAAYTPNITLNASPSVVAPNTNTQNPTAQFSVLTATVRDGTPNNNLVQGVPVAFTISSDSSGGKLSSPSVITTQSNGQAQINYYPGGVSTSQDGVQIKAVIQGAVTNFATTALTVGSQALFVTLGTGNTMSALDQTSYQQPWAVYVTDAAGQPVANATVTATLEATSYSKGTLFWNGVYWQFGAGLPTDGDNLALTATGGPWCLNTDASQNGVWSPSNPIQIFYPYPSPQDPASVTNNHTDYPFVMPGIPGNVTSGVTTNTNGYATLNVTYPKNHAVWTNVVLTATAATIGTQSSGTAYFNLEGLAADYATQTVSPPGATSPYGINNCQTAF
jgi:hypothetical protein